MDTIENMVAAVKSHAIKNYETDGWDTIVECYADEIREGKCKTCAEAIAYVGKGCKIYDEVRKDIRATAF